MSSTERVKKFLEELKDDNIRFKEHFYEKTKERPISEGMVREYVKKAELLLRAEEQPARRVGEEKYKLWFKLSNKYSLVIIAAMSKKDLYIITGWNTERRWQREIQK